MHTHTRNDDAMTYCIMHDITTCVLEGEREKLLKSVERERERERGLENNCTVQFVGGISLSSST